MAKRLFIRAIVRQPDGAERTINVIGRNAWALETLVEAGPFGCTPIDQPAPRWSAYVHNLRHEYELRIETLDEPHGGLFSGTHARYVLRDQVEVVKREVHHD